MSAHAYLWLLVALLSACAEPGSPERAAASGKPGAPVIVSALVGAGQARVDIRARRTLDSVDVEIYGLDDLRVTSPSTPLHGLPLAAGARASFDASLDGFGRFAVKVTTWRGATRRVHTAAFRVGDGPRLRPPRGRLERDGRGRRMRVLPARSLVR